MADLWMQFRRLLLGTVVEHLLDHGVQVDFQTIRIDFSPDSEFRVPRLDNFMRFKGELSAELTSAPPGAVDSLARALRGVWPDLLSVVDIPIGDRLTSDRNQLDVGTETIDGRRRLRVRFDLVAD